MEENHKFKIGDRVRVKDIDYSDIMEYYSGKIGVLEKTRRSQFDFRLMVEGYGILVYKEEIEHVRIADTKTARKIYEKNIDKIEDGWLYLK